MRHYVFAFVTTAGAAAIGSAASFQAPSFYMDLQKPAWAPPPAVFGPVWTVLYIMIAIASGMALSKSAGRSRRVIGVVFVAQLVLNALWSWLFFAWRQGGLAFVDIVMLATFIAALILLCWRVSRISAAILLPYLLWVCFASALNFAVWRMNVTEL